MTSSTSPAYSATRPRPLKLSFPTFPASAVEVLESYSSYLDFLRITRACAARKGLDRDDVVQNSALRIVRNNPTINDSAHWNKFCATVAFSVCNDEWRSRFRLPTQAVSLDEEDQFGTFSWDQKASLRAMQIQLENEVFAELVRKQGAALLQLVGSSSRLPEAARRVLNILLDAADREESYKKNGRLNGNAIARDHGISQSTISRQLPVIQEAAAGVLAEMEASEGMDMW